MSDVWNHRFVEIDPRLASIAAAARAFADDLDWPPVATWNARLEAHGLPSPVTFVTQHAPLRRRGAGRAPYDAEITLHARVPSRERCWHDFLNMLTWAAFPLTKMAIHRRQREAAEARETTPHNRGRERDALSMLDEGGVLVAGETIVFGHALHEHVVTRRVISLYAAALVIPLTAEGIDASAAQHVATTPELCSPHTLGRIPFDVLAQSEAASERSTPGTSESITEP